MSGGSPDSRSTEGARALLFDRLVDDHPSVPVEQRPFRVLTLEGLRQSVQKEVSRLLNTRSPISAEEMEEKEGAWTILEWGLPDYTGWYTRSPPQQQRLARLIESTLRAFEPRLKDPAVSVVREEEDNRSLTVRISGSVKLGSISEPVSFPLALQGPGVR